MSQPRRKCERQCDGASVKSLAPGRQGHELVECVKEVPILLSACRGSCLAVPRCRRQIGLQWHTRRRSEPIESLLCSSLKRYIFLVRHAQSTWNREVDLMKTVRHQKLPEISVKELEILF